MSFYMTLPCDSSRHIYPQNRVGNFTTVLLREVVLEGDYEVGLSECVIPVSKRSLNFVQPMIINEKGATVRYFTIDASKINSMMDWYDEGVQLPKTKDGNDVFQFTTREGRVVMKVAPQCQLFFGEQNNDLALLLGFAPGKYDGSETDYKEYVATKPFGGTLSFTYIYCDLVEYSFVGDSMVPCLRTLPVVPGNDEITVYKFENPHYVPVSKGRFSTVSIEIANDRGEEIQFSKGLSMIKLHFRPKKK